MKIAQIDPRDDLIVALQALNSGEEVALGSRSWTLPGAVAMKHKFAARDVAAGERVMMYGVTVGTAVASIRRGEAVGTHNLVHAADVCQGQQRQTVWTPPQVQPWVGRTFEGFANPSGTGPAGTANHWIVLPLVFCENRNLGVMRESMLRVLGYSHISPYQHFLESLHAAHQRGASAEDLAALSLSSSQVVASARPFPFVDGIKFLEHGLGCGGTRQDAVALCRLLAGYIAHPNVAGATVLSLGCQHAQVSLLESALSEVAPHCAKPLLIYEQQKSQSESQMLEHALRDTYRGLQKANERRRSPQPLSDLILGVECGGSDGFSGISANPVVGHAADILAALGGTPVLSEFPELCGIEQDLCDRCTSPALADRFLSLMKAYAQAAEACGSGFDMNPSPGNIRDGLITDAMKSAGAAKKGGTAPVVEVLDYTEPIRARGGLSLLCTPGNDVESTTALAASGCTLMAFTTGLGTPTGNPVCPTLKVATHTALAQRMADIIDFDAGPLLTGEKTLDELGAAFFDQLIETASGRFLPQAVRLGQDDFLPWKRGVSL